MIKIILIIYVLVVLTGCGPTLFTIGGVDVTAGQVVSMPVKKKVLEDIELPTK
tara:strand:+ start:489 stop:647 length:159 start_codon:yes stop_codon:yes gene_type:complete